MNGKKLKPFAVFDIDGTLFRSGLYREVVYELIRNKVMPSSILQTIIEKEKAWQKRAHGSAFVEFEQALVEAMNAALPKLKITDFDQAAQNVIDAHRDNVYVYTRDLARDLKAKGYTLIAISGSHKELVEPFAKHYNFDICVGAEYERGDQFFTGKALSLTHKGKDTYLSQLILEHNLTLDRSVAVGDSRGDIEMLAMVENPIAFNPERELFEAAAKNSWKIVIERKNMVYELEPKDDQFILKLNK